MQAGRAKVFACLSTMRIEYGDVSMDGIGPATPTYIREDPSAESRWVCIPGRQRGSRITDRSRSVTEISVSTAEVYSQRDNPAFEAWLATKTASREGGFFLPHLRAGMRVLDV